MEDIKKLFKKFGGMNLIKQYAKAGVLPFAITIAPLLGFTRKGLEIFRLSVQYKIQQKLYKKYKEDIEVYDNDIDWDSFEHHHSNKVWICWLQGMDNAPPVVKHCFESLKQNLSNKEIVLITLENIFEYADFPDYIIEKWEKGIITYTHITDLLRLELLIKHGGIWLDATVFCSSSNIPEYYFTSDLFFYQCLKPGKDGHSIYISSWLMSATTNNKILMVVQYLCYKYWKENNSMVDYFLLHNFMSIVLEYYPEDWKRVVPSDNATPHILLLRLFDQYNEQIWKYIKEQTPFHKLSYKFEKGQTEIVGTFYKEIFS